MNSTGRRLRSPWYDRRGVHVQTESFRTSPMLTTRPVNLVTFGACWCYFHNCGYSACELLMALLSSNLPGRYARRWTTSAFVLLALAVFLLSLQTRLALYTPQASHSPIGSMKLAVGEPALVLITHKGELHVGKRNPSLHAGLHSAVLLGQEPFSSGARSQNLENAFVASPPELYRLFSRPPPAVS